MKKKFLITTIIMTLMASTNVFATSDYNEEDVYVGSPHTMYDISHLVPPQTRNNDVGSMLPDPGEGGPVGDPSAFPGSMLPNHEEGGPVGEAPNTPGSMLPSPGEGGPTAAPSEPLGFENGVFVGAAIPDIGAFLPFGVLEEANKPSTDTNTNTNTGTTSTPTTVPATSVSLLARLF